MEKTPEEIKKGLECCSGGTCRKGGCPYAPFIKCGSNMHDDAIEYILQLEQESRCADALLKDAITCIKRLESQVPKWVSVKERLPEEYSNCIVWNGAYINVALYWGDGRWWPAGGYFVNDITHWMPLPEGPKEG